MARNAQRASAPVSEIQLPEIDPIRYSRGIGATDVHPKQSAAASFREFSEVILGDLAPAAPGGWDEKSIRNWKGTVALPWIAQPFGGNGMRTGKNAEPWALLILDVDGVKTTLGMTAMQVAQMTIDEMRKRAPSFGWKTTQHTPLCPRFRLVLHLNRPVNADESKTLVAVLVRDLTVSLGSAIEGVKFDTSMQSEAHIAFLRHTNRGVIPLREDVEPLDVDACLARAPVKVVDTASTTGGLIGRPHTAETEAEVRVALNRVDARHPNIVDDRQQWLRVLASLKSFGWPDAVMGPIAREWSAQSSRYDADRWEVDWRSLKVEGGISPATLFFLSGQAEDDCASFGTDDGFACRFASWLGGSVMYARGRFYQWTGAYWQPDSGAVAALLKVFAREQADEAARAFHSDPTDEGKKTRVKAARNLLQQNVQDRVTRAVQTMLRVEDGELDRDEYLLACSNGTVNLRDGTLKPSDPTDRITRCTGHLFDPNARALTWCAFIGEALGDSGSVDWFQRFIGYCATGDVREEKMLLATGPGGTGKSTALKAIMHALGGEAASTGYCTAAASALLSDNGKRGANEHTGGLTPLVGKRLAAINEVKAGERWDDALFKQLVSREPIQMREVGGARAFTVVPTWKIWVRGNHLPRLVDVTDAFFRRVAILEFKFRPDKVDDHLDERLRGEASGILGWIVTGALEWQQRGLQMPKVMREVLDSFRAEQDMFGDWLATRTEPGGFTPSEELRYDYDTYAGQTRRPTTAKAFAAMMRERGYEPIKYRGARGFAVVFKRQDDSAFDPSDWACRGR